MAVSSLGPNYSDADYMQRDGVDGSGSGSGPDFEDEEREEDYMRGSGSGDGPNHEGLSILSFTIYQLQIFELIFSLSVNSRSRSSF